MKRAIIGLASQAKLVHSVKIKKSYFSIFISLPILVILFFCFVPELRAENNFGNGLTCDLSKLDKNSNETSAGGFLNDLTKPAYPTDWKLLYAFSFSKSGLEDQGVVIGTSIKDPTVFLEVGFFTSRPQRLTKYKELSLYKQENADGSISVSYPPYFQGNINFSGDADVDLKGYIKDESLNQRLYLTIDLGKTFGYSFRKEKFKILSIFLKSADVRAGAGFLARTDFSVISDSFVLKNKDDVIYESPAIPNVKVATFVKPTLVVEPGVRLGLGIRIGTKHIFSYDETLNLITVGLEL